ncbi:hypothetical protein TrST_g4552 [Triparma strigata]|uniref:Uncharacterized protein n=1 Tax=Triparma strigata TaxID=1606541 RepID=A0A9W7EFS1_9STRA|nr:hypothetical protein TrST_g4552 [Triparma strigata]
MVELDDGIGDVQDLIGTQTDTHIDMITFPSEYDHGTNYESYETLEGRLQLTASNIMKWLNYENYDVSIILTDLEHQTSHNNDAFGKNSPTDVLSFPSLLSPSSSPGTVDDLTVEFPFTSPSDVNLEICSSMMHLGDIFLCPRYAEYVLACDLHSHPLPNYSEWTSAGASGTMAETRDLGRRCDILILHGLLHLIGYDHVNGEEEKMTMEALEEMAIKELKL